MTKTDIKKFLESDETFKQIDNVLSSLAGQSMRDIVEGQDGFVAGGCVANTIYSMLYGGNPVLNDIDVFSIKTKAQMFNGDTLTIDGGDHSWYNHKWKQKNGTFSIIKSHHRDGILNYVDVLVDVRGTDQCKLQTILSSFDINVCQAGLDYTNNKIIYTEDFLDFLSTKQMLVTVPINPMQTSIRLLKKLKDLECYCDINNELRLLQYVMTLPREVSQTFGKETYDKYLQHKSNIDLIFNINKVVDDRDMDKEDWQYQGMYVEGVDLWVFEPKLRSYELEYGVRSVRELIGYWRLFETPISKPKKNKIQKILKFLHSKGINEHPTKHSGLHLNDFGEPDPTRAHITTHTMGVMVGTGRQEQGLRYLHSIKDVSVMMPSHELWYNLLTIQDYVDCDFAYKHLVYISKFLKNHSMIRLLFSNQNIQEQYNLIRTIKSISNKRGEWVIGELESIYDIVKLDELTKSKDQLTWLNSFFDEIESKLQKTLIEPLNISDFEHSGCITELTTTLDLRGEGVKMGHCVGGYSSKITNGSSRIFHIQCDGIGSTVEIGLIGSIWPKFNRQTARVIPDDWKDGNETDIKLLKTLDHTLEHLSYKKQQHQGRHPEKGNKEPTEKNINVVKELVSYLNENHLKESCKEILWERHQLEEKIRKEMFDKSINKDTTSITVTEHPVGADEYHMPQSRNIPIDDLWM